MSEDAGEKTEAPTARRRQEARDQGNIARSTDLTSAVLLLGTEAYQRRRIKEAMTANYSGDGYTQHDLSEMTLAEVVDDARALSLFASERLIWAVNAEAAMPRSQLAATLGSSSVQRWNGRPASNNLCAWSKVCSSVRGTPSGPRGTPSTP